MKNGHWKFETEINPLEYEGFIYKITEINTGKEYIGKKNFWAKRKNKYVESNWRSYTSSSKLLNEVIKINGKDNYLFEIISLHYNKSFLSYREIEELVFNDVLRATLPNGEKKFYNKAIGNIKFVHQDVISNATRKKLSAARKGRNKSEEHRAKMSAASKGRNKSEEHRAKMSAARKGRNKSEEHRAKLSLPKKIVICPHCNKSGGINIMNRWHFNNCKQN
jgi:hypothetical protein